MKIFFFQSQLLLREKYVGVFLEVHKTKVWSNHLCATFTNIEYSF